MVRNHSPQRRSEQGGFTLVELLVVIVILGILAAIVVFAVGGITDKGQTSANSIDATNLEVAEEAFFANGKPVGGYTTETIMLQTSYLRSVSVNNYVCLKLPAAANGLYADYYVLPAPLPTDQASADGMCSLATNVAAANKPLGSMWTGSDGAAAP